MEEITMNDDTRKSEMIYVIFFGTLFFVFSYYIFTELTKGVITKDFPSHMEGAELILDGQLLTLLKADSYPLWQIFVALMAALFRMPVAAATALVCSLLNVADFLLIIRFFNHYEFRAKTIAPLSCALLLLGPMYLPWYNPNIYLGQGTPNVWHNPTTICVRPFALATFLLIIHLLKKGEEQKECRRKEFTILAVMLVCCNLAKPSFMQGLIPGLGLYFVLKLVRQRGKNLMFYLKMAAAFVPCVLLLAIQWVISFQSSPSAEGGIAISLFEVMKRYSPNILISTVLGMAFPLYVMIGRWKTVRKKPELQLLGCTVFAAYLEQSLLMETGYRKYHGNFGWAYLVFMFLTYVFSLREFLLWNRAYEYDRRGERSAVGIGWVLFFIQLAIGVYYTFHLYR